MESEYDEHNNKLFTSLDNLTSNNPHLLYNKPLIPDVSVNRSRPFKNQIFESEYMGTLGNYKDNPQDKFFKEHKINSGHIKPLKDNSHLAKGTNKASMNMEGYTGKIY